MKGGVIEWLNRSEHILSKKQPYAANVVIYVTGFVDFRSHALAEVWVGFFKYLITLKEL